ncbi:MAG TPA: hypothetical protein VFK97_01065 [Candidatus Saccharimonadales bacterium]|nr:hypothetical protein [Candidatus Saccharimonadales bacterium]
MRKFLDTILTRKSRKRKEFVVPPRLSELREAVVQILELAGRPMRKVEVHLACEELLGRSIHPNTVKNCLHRNSRGDRAVFRKVDRGLYENVPASLQIRRRRHPGSGLSPEATN